MFNKKQIILGKGIGLIDACIIVFSTVFAYLLRFNFEIPDHIIPTWSFIIPYMLIVRLILFRAFRTYAGLIIYTSTQDAQKILFANIIGTLIFCLTTVGTNMLSAKNAIPYSIIIMEFIFSSFFMTSFRLFVKILYLELRNLGKAKRNVMIFGAGEYGLITKRTMDRDAGTKYNIVGFLDTDEKIINNKIEGKTIFHVRDSLSETLTRTKTDWLIFSETEIDPELKQEVIDTCLKLNVRILNVPPMQQWINGELSFRQIKKINITDLLERSPIELNKKNIRKQLSGKTVLVTGGAGSIGSEIVRQVLLYDPELVLIYDQAETPVFELEVELRNKFRDQKYAFIVGDIRDKRRLEQVFSTYAPHIVYHAAAYKHVPVMEENPSEAVSTNIFGTIHIADLAVAHRVEKVVFVSTDKAVNPTNVMGCSKRISEIYVQSLHKKLHQMPDGAPTRFVTTRFGNVLGSNGSVIKLFNKQIQSGGPVTITHKDVTRFFMTIPEACQLVLEAGAMGKGGEIFIFDMGESVKIVDLARKMIKLSGLELGKDINLVFTGLRPGEKLYEELLNDKENTLPTHHPKIMIANVREYEYLEVVQEIEALRAIHSKLDNDRIVQKMKQLVPEYISNNSRFAKLDKKETEFPLEVERLPEG